MNIKDKIIDKICEAIAMHVPYTFNEIKNLYIQHESIDKIMWIIDMAEHKQCMLSEVFLDLKTKSVNTERKEIKDTDENFKKQWLKKRQRGIGVKDIRFRFGRDKR